MKLIVGLGNPGKEYENTRHNIGFLAIDAFAEKHHGDWQDWGKQTESFVVQMKNDGSKVFLQKPMTYMNLSGMAVQEIASFYKIDPKEICVVYDDMDLLLGSIQLRVGGGDAGHNGIKSLVQHLGTTEFARIRMGIGKPNKTDKKVVDFVLEKFSKSEKPEVDFMTEKAVSGMEAFLKSHEEFRLAMNILNRKVHA